MVKRYYMSRIALVFSAPMTLLAFTIFIVAWFDNRNTTAKLKPVMIVLAIILFAVMFFYYKNKLGISSALRKVKNIGEYENGGMLERSFVLEDRMLAGVGLRVKELKTTGVKQMDLEEKGRKLILHITNEEGTYDAQVIDKDEAERFAAFMKRKNPGIILNNVKTKGNGTLRELGAGVTVSPLSKD